MISPLASDIYTANAVAAGQAIPRYKVEPVPSVEQHEQSKPNAVHDEAVKVEISDEAKDLMALLDGAQLPVEKTPDRSPTDYSKNLKKRSEHPLTEQVSKEDKASEAELDESEKEQVRELEERDREVKTHEQQHAAVGGAYTRGGPSFEFQTGPDGKQYAVGGHVDIDTSEGSTPEETVRKAQVIQAAATAPANPSGADLKIAAAAAAMQSEAMQELAQKPATPTAKKGSEKDDDKSESDDKSINTDSEDKSVRNNQRVTKALRAYKKAVNFAS